MFLLSSFLRSSTLYVVSLFLSSTNIWMGSIQAIIYTISSNTPRYALTTLRSLTMFTETFRHDSRTWSATTKMQYVSTDVAPVYSRDILLRLPSLTLGMSRDTGRFWPRMAFYSHELNEDLITITLLSLLSGSKWIIWMCVHRRQLAMWSSSLLFYLWSIRLPFHVLSASDQLNPSNIRIFRKSWQVLRSSF